MWDCCVAIPWTRAVQFTCYSKPDEDHDQVGEVSPSIFD